MRRALAPLLLLLALAPARADVPPDLARLLREAGLAPADATRALRDAGVTPADARALLSARGSLGAPEPGKVVTLTDGQGRSTTLEFRAPEGPAPAAGYPVVLVLHGLGGEGKQLLPLARKLAPPQAILLAPSAQYLAPEAENEDMWDIGANIEQAPDGDAAARRREQLKRLMRLARDQIFPHWWSYKSDCFPLQALAWAEQRWPIDPDRVVLLGYSMGGYGTWNIGLRYPDRFAGIVPIAGGISRRENTGPRDEASRALLRNGCGLPSFFLHGNADPIVPVRFSRTIHEELTGLGAPHEYIEVEGEGHHLREFLAGDASTERVKTWIGERQRNAHPRRIDHTALGAYQGSAWWVRVDALRGKVARVEAEVQEGNRIALRTQGVGALSVFLDPALIDPSKPVTIELDGAVVHEGLVPASLEATVESWSARRDPSLVFEHMLRLEVPAPAAPAPAAPAQTPRGF